MAIPWNPLAIKAGGTSATTPFSARRALGIVTQGVQAHKPNGTNDTANLQAAVTEAAGEPVLLQEGTYIVTSPITYLTTGAYVPGMNIVGRGMKTIIDNRVANGSCFQSASTSSGFFQLGGGISNLKMITTTSPASSNGIEMQAAYDWGVRNVYIKGLSGDAYRITCNLGDLDAAIEPTIDNCWFESCLRGYNSNFASTVTQVSFLTVRNTFFISCNIGCRYIGAAGVFENNAFVTSVNQGFQAVFNNANNPQLLFIGNTFENNGTPQLGIDSLLAGTFINTEIATTVSACTAGVYVCQSGSGDGSGIVFDGTYVRIGASFNPYTAFTLGTNSVFVSIRNTKWQTFDAAGQVRYADTGSSNRISDSGSRLVLGNGASGANITLANGANQNVALPVEGTIFLISGPSGAFNIGGFTHGVGDNNREFYLSNNTGQVLTLNNEDGSSTAANRLKMDNGTNVTINTSGCAHLVYMNSRWQVVGHG